MERDKAVLRCSFCTKEQGPTRRLIGGPTDVFICTDCVALCGQIALADRLAPGEPVPILITAEMAAYRGSQPTYPDTALMAEVWEIRAILERVAAAVESLRAEITVMHGKESGNSL
jgi:ClpX C4-type zinc finger protein